MRLGDEQPGKTGQSKWSSAGCRHITLPPCFGRSAWKGIGTLEGPQSEGHAPPKPVSFESRVKKKMAPLRTYELPKLSQVPKHQQIFNFPFGSEHSPKQP